MTDYLNNYNGRRILVTGGAGAIGSRLVRKLIAVGARVIVLDNLTSGYIWNLPRKSDNLLFIKGDVTKDADLKKSFNGKPEIIFHLAAFFANQNSVDHPEKDLHTNGLGTLKLLEYSALNDLGRFVYASSGCAIYGAHAPLPLKEEFVSLHLSSPYQITKSLGEMYCNFFYHHYGLQVVKARFFNSYGPGEVPGQYRNVIPNFIYWAMKGRPLPITGTGEETRDFTFVEDLVDGLLRAGVFEAALGQEFNLASGREVKIADLAAMINRAAVNTAGVIKVPKRKWDTKPRLLASISRAKQLIKYEPKAIFEEGLLQTIAWFKENWHLIEKSASFNPGIK